MNAYDEKYLDDAMHNLGEAFDYAVNACQLPMDRFWDLFVTGGYAGEFGTGNPRIVSGRSGTELVMETVEKAGQIMAFPDPRTDFECSPEYWAGWSLTYYQWKTGRSFKDIHVYISGRELLKLYPTLHEAAEEKFADVAD